MIRPLPVCPKDALFSLLDDSLTEIQTAAVTFHINECESCRTDLEKLAASPLVWRETSDILSDPSLRTEATSSLPRSELIGENVGPHPVSDVQIRNLLPMLTPPEQPQNLGRLDHYEIESVVGWGGMGVVLRGFDSALGRPVAIKVLHPHLAAHGTARRRFAREAKAAAAVNHPAVVPIHSVYADSQPPYLVMAFVPGGSLQDRLDREGPLETAEILRIGYQIADALAAAHAQGLVHRDVKPGNILLDHGQNRVMLTDFGLAQALDDATLTASGLIAGTPQYMSPEQARGEAVDMRSDLFSLGGVLYAMASGRPPFRGDSTLAVLRQIGNVDPKPVCEIQPDVPSWLGSFIASLLSRNATDRPQSAAEVATLLRECLAHVRQPLSNSLPKSIPLALPPTKTAGSKTSLPAALAWLFARRRPASWAIGILAAMLMLIAASMVPKIDVWLRGANKATQSQSENTSVQSEATQNQSSPLLPFDKTQWDDGFDLPLRQLRQQLEAARNP